jgi:D-aspartate ligase
MRHLNSATAEVHRDSDIDVRETDRRKKRTMSSPAGSGEVPVFVLGSSLTAVGVVRSLGRTGLPVYSLCNPHELVTKSRWYRPAPQTGRPVPPEELAAYLESLSIQKAVLIPSSDDWARAAAELPESLRGRFPASVPDPQVMQILTDKWCFAEMLQSLGVAGPKTILLRSLDEMSNLPDAQYEGMFLKPTNSQEFALRHNVKAFRLESKKHALAIMAGEGKSGAGFPILLQEYIPGPADKYFLVDGFADRHHRIRALIARRRLRMYPPRFGNSTFSETIPLGQVQEAVDTVERLCSALKYRGIFDAEFKYDDRDGRYKMVEINARPWWFVEFATRCGMDLCRMAYDDALDLEVKQVTTYRVGQRCFYLHSDLAAQHAADPGVGGLLRWFRSVKGADEILYCWDDPKPGVFSTLAALKSYFGRLLSPKN